MVHYVTSVCPFVLFGCRTEKLPSRSIFVIGYILGVSVLVYPFYYPRRARSALGVDIVLTLDVCLYVCMFVCLYVCMYVSALERKRLIGMT